MTTDAPSAEDVLTLWFDLPNKNEKDDDRVEDKLGPYYDKALTGEYDHWKNSPKGRLALIILFDQVPRHLFRNQPEQYRTDNRALALSEIFFEEGFPRSFDYPEIFYAVMPYLHAEDVDRQRTVNPIIHECAEAIGELSFMGGVADDYLKVIERFGRFPHRNEILDRECTPGELQWLSDNKSS